MQYTDLPKHIKYKGAYRAFDYYWGLGIEHETYLKTSQIKEISTFEGAMKPERYSVNYYAVYKTAPLLEALGRLLALEGGKLCVPFLVNSHSMTHCDVYNIHRTTYEKIPKLNPSFEGKTFWDWICSVSPWMRLQFDKCFTWDGDTVEFMTQGFYNTTVKECMKELRYITGKFEQELRALPRRGILTGYGPLSLAAPKNEPFAIHLTNLRNVAMFNNGTLHINVTLPTRLGWNRKPLCWKRFVGAHRRLARLIQWLEPVFVAVYGSGDPLAVVSDRYAAGSQRVAVSRYIGIGTFDTDKMSIGKILTMKRADLGPMPWYDWLAERTDYIQLDSVGLDLNFNKHGAHGLELRFFDQIPYDSLESLLETLVLCMDASLALKDIVDPRKDGVWSSMAGQGLLEGKGWQLSVEQQERLYAVCCIRDTLCKEPQYVEDVWKKVCVGLERYKGVCWKRMVGSRL
jgi:hypothetical protein